MKIERQHIIGLGVLIFLVYIGSQVNTLASDEDYIIMTNDKFYGKFGDVMILNSDLKFPDGYHHGTLYYFYIVKSGTDRITEDYGIITEGDTIAMDSPYIFKFNFPYEGKYTIYMKNIFTDKIVDKHTFEVIHTV